jgi:MoCo/4Fe-4S cofactor protein with predicted Tat translocation signal
MKPSKPLSDNLTGPRYWRSLDELQDTAEFKNWVHREFPQGASELEGVNRRHFLRIMGASFAAAGVGLAGCRRPEQYIAPYARQTGDGVPEATIPGLPVHFTTSFPDAVDNLPLVVETHQNRPTHIEGNRDYAPYGGGIHGFASASVLDLYDPDRMTSASRGTQRLTRSGARDALQALAAGFVATGGQELAFLATPSTSPTRRRLVAALQSRFPRAVWAEYEPMPRDTADRAASEVFGESVRPVFHLGRARKILSLDSDFLNKEGGSIALARGFAAGRRVANAEEAQRMNRLYAVESAFTLTGAMADHRLRLGASEMGAFAALLVAELLEALGTDASFAASLRSRAGSLPLDAQWIPECVRDLIAHRGEAVVLAGSHLPAAVHQLVVMANELLEARNRTVEYLSVPAPQGASLAELATAMREGRVKSLVILGGNPVYNAPADLDFAGLLRGLEEVVRCGYHHDETSLEAGARGGLNLPYTHYLESWGDGRTFDGTFVPVQPMILPLFGGCWQENEILALLAGLSETDPYAVALATFREAFGGTDKDYRRFLSVGFQSGSAFSALGAAPSLARIKTAVSSAELSAPGLHGENLEVRLAKDDSGACRSTSTAASAATPACRLPGREQHPGRRQAGGRQRQPRDALDPHRPLLPGRSEDTRGGRHPAGALPVTARWRPASRSARSRPRCTPTEGLNAMVYNRCVGTRYCSNNCPYKVRRFNFFNNLKELTETEKMRLNPEVTVRSRGVMEKCTYCVQRIETAKITARNERRPLQDGEITPACAQTCPTEAIVFGDLNDSTSRVSQAAPRSAATTSWPT